MSRTNSRKNYEGYCDPTAYEALSTVMKEEQSAKPDYPRVYICSPFKGDAEANTASALRFCRFALERGTFPIAPHCYLPRFMDDELPAQRELALSFGIRLLHGCRELWVFGDVVSDGMKREISAAKRRYIPIRYFRENCEEVG